MKRISLTLLLTVTASACSTYKTIGFDDLGPNGRSLKTVRIELGDKVVYESKLARTQGDSLLARVLRKGVLESRILHSGSRQDVPKWLDNFVPPVDRVFQRREIETLRIEAANAGVGAALVFGVPIAAVLFACRMGCGFSFP